MIYKKIIKVCSFTISLLLFLNCGSQVKNKGKGIGEMQILQDSILSEAMKNDQPLAFPLPEIPQNIREPRERARYMIMHFWEKLPVNDTTLYGKRSKDLESSLANFVYLASNFNPNEIKEALLSPLNKSNGKLLAYILELYKKYYYDPYSPIVNDEFYLPILQWASTSSKIDYAESVRLKARLELVQKNRIGKKATDFSYISPDASTHHLYDIKSPYKVLAFYAPICPNCTIMLRDLSQSAVLDPLLESRKVSFLFIATDPLFETWKENLDKIPSYAMVGLNEDRKIRDLQLYDLKKIPSIYVLDKNNIVLLKDKNIQESLDFLAKKLKITDK